MTNTGMRTIRLGKQPTLETIAISHEPIPTPGAGEVLVRIHATSLNFHDYLVVAGHIPVAEGLVPMSDGAGEVVALGAGVTEWTPGDKVMGAFFPLWLTGRPDFANNAAVSGETANGFASEYVVATAASLSRMPTGWSFEEAATLPCAGLTAWRALTVEGRLQPGDTALLPGSGGLCVYALQLGKALGLTIIMTSSSDEKLARLATMGADYSINYRKTPDWGQRAIELTHGAGVDLVLEIGGQSSFAQSVIACRMGGRLSVVGSTANAAPELPLRNIIMHHIQVGGMAVGSVEQLRALVLFVEQHGIRPVIDRSFPIEQLRDAFAHQLSGKHFGKIVATF